MTTFTEIQKQARKGLFTSLSPLHIVAFFAQDAQTPFSKWLCEKLEISREKWATKEQSQQSIMQLLHAFFQQRLAKFKQLEAFVELPDFHQNYKEWFSSLSKEAQLNGEALLLQSLLHSEVTNEFWGAFRMTPAGFADVASIEQRKDNDTRFAKKQLPIGCSNLVDAAKANTFHKAIGRDSEIRQISQILLQKQCNNPLLIGEPGVGKTAIVEHLAIEIANGEVPETLKQAQLIEIDLNAIMAGAQNRGAFEERFQTIIDYCLAENRKVILFIDEIHSLVNAGKTTGSAGAADILKPYLSRGKINLIGATTFNEYRMHLESDPAFQRRLQVVRVPEPDLVHLKQILTGVLPYYTDFHQVKCEPATVETILNVAQKYLPEQYFPDKAIRVIDRACASAVLDYQDIVDSGRMFEAISELSDVPKTTIEASKKELQSSSQSLLNLKDNDIQWQESSCLIAGKLMKKIAQSDYEILSKAIFGKSDKYYCLNLGGYDQSSAKSRLIGAEPGLVGFETPGLIESVYQRMPAGVWVFRQHNQAHSSVQELISEIAETGQIQTAQGKTLHFSASIIVIEI